MQESGYWSRVTLNRRRLLRSSALAGGSIAALSLIGCNSDDDGGGSGSNAGKTDTSIDPTKGKAGGTLITQSSGYPNSFNPIAATLNAQYAGYAHASLLQYKHGKAHSGVANTDVSVEPELAQAMPEQPDETTYIFKLKDARFHNGRPVTSEDVKYSLDRYQNAPYSGSKTAYAWVDRVDTPDAMTAVVKTKGPFADTLAALVNYNFYVVAKEHQESDAVNTSYMGAGPFIYVDTQPPLYTRFRRNPDYFDKPYPYFDELVILGVSDEVKRVADFTTGQTNSSAAFRTEQATEIKAARPTAVEWAVFFAAYSIHMRTDQVPFNDKRVRQALSMTIDRAKIREGTNTGPNSDDDQYLSWVNQDTWGFRKPKDLGASAKYWVYNPTEAKALLSAAGVQLPIRTDFTHWNATVNGQAFTDTATLTSINWKNLGIADLKHIETNIATSTTTTGVGNYNGIHQSPSGVANTPNFGIQVRQQFYVPPEGIKTPTTNVGYISDQRLSDLSEKQLTQLKAEDRKATFRQMEEIIADEQYKLPFSTYYSGFFTDEKLRNVQIPRFHFSGSRVYQRYWWWEK